MPAAPLFFFFLFSLTFLILFYLIIQKFIASAGPMRYSPLVSRDKLRTMLTPRRGGRAEGGLRRDGRVQEMQFYKL